ncbi:MAG: MarR family protein [Candidatus Izimaplasma bacterium HR2]|nr:MAG: MarR family protein [Candidatus Izimaplasma bacterium HR2]
MDKEELRISFNKFLKMYFDSCKEVYDEINASRITGRQFRYLREIHKREEATLTELAEHFQISKPSMNEVLNKFENTKIIKKRRSETDKRYSYISLTDIGVILATSNELESKRAVTKMFETLNEKEILNIKNSFDKFGDDHK